MTQWTTVEQQQFKKGVIKHGWGKWKLLSEKCIATRTMEQVKSHAQKFLKWLVCNNIV